VPTLETSTGQLPIKEEPQRGSVLAGVVERLLWEAGAELFQGSWQKTPGPCRQFQGSACGATLRYVAEGPWPSRS